MRKPRPLSDDWLAEYDRKRREEEAREVPYAEIKPGGVPWCWWVYIHHGVFVWGPDGGPSMWWGTRAGAERYARYLLRKYLRIKGLENRERKRVEIDSPEDFTRQVRARHAREDALAELRADPAEAWEREFAALTPARRRPWWRR
ncbi:hypothetical protein QDA01_gp54 [Microbacterium phage Cinna]|uniref:Uncharacterized protein n=2 Tax=Mementomorivirus TaxID=2733194 RepID=A0A2Z4Q5H8_9CAUD|nr:hypothetical protein HOT41_gp57 [Microbacterium phage MementoMori]YP_010751058.1 hypothetical protein QDA01_gp54 [Microbacterium phage Cinna]AWY05306.1 hypothetical protein SEA_MEMENTOMORI_52 [Microbacterium phage MementoMori]QDH91635.1 hypothetical protein PBI_CINNA_51 [Microbacterium phage Cinna]